MQCGEDLRSLLAENGAGLPSPLDRVSGLTRLQAPRADRPAADP